MKNSSHPIPYRALLWLLLAALLCSLLPLLVLGRYDVPSADDFSYGAAAHQAYATTGSFFRAVAKAAEQTAVTYRDWQGTFSAVFLMALQPAVFGEQYYILTPFLMLAGLLLGLFCLSLALYSRVFGLERSLSGCIAAVLALLCIQLVPSPVQGFYWFNGAVYYTFFHGLAFAAVALGIRLVREGGAGKALLLCLLAFLLGGSNYVTALSLTLLGFGFLLLLLLMKKPGWKRLVLPLLLLLLGFGLSAAAPGNAMRQGTVSHTPNAIAAVLASFRSGASYSLRWFSFPLLGALLFLLPLFWDGARRSRFSFRFPALVTLFSYCLLSAMFCPTLYALGDVGDKRLLNIIFYSYVFLLTGNVFYWVGWMTAKRREAKPISLPALFLAAVLCLGCCALQLRSGGYTTLMALGALRSGEAAAYYAAAQERLALLRDPAQRDLVLEPYPCTPYLLYFDDCTDDPADWRNESVSAYYGKDSVVVRSLPTHS